MSVSYERARLRLWPAAILFAIAGATGLVWWLWWHMEPVSVSNCSTFLQSDTVLLNATLHNRSSKQLYRTDVTVKTNGIHNGGGSESVYAFFDPIAPYDRARFWATINAVISGDTRDSRLGHVVSCRVTAVEFGDGSKWTTDQPTH